MPAFGSQVLRSITRDQLQAFLDRKAATLSRSVVDHLRWDLNAIFKTALSDGLVDCNPAAALFTPPCKPEGDKRVMTPDEIRLALSVLDLRERLMFRMAVFDGMRPGEILAVRLGNISEHSIFVDQRVYKGDLDTPKGYRGLVPAVAREKATGAPGASAGRDLSKCGRPCDAAGPRSCDTLLR